MSGDTRAAELELVRRMRAGDLLAFEDVYRQHGTRLYNLAVRMLGQPADAEDAVQEAFLLAFRKLDGFKGEAALGTWLYRLAMNLYVDRLRSKATRKDQRTDALGDHEAVLAQSSDTGIELAVTRMDLERAVSRLPEGCRAAFVLHDVEGFDHREVGTILGISEGTSKSQVHKARLRLRQILLAAARPTRP
jgi:RNA polymerase sigma-70 factor (ECF subfamily)